MSRFKWNIQASTTFSRRSLARRILVEAVRRGRQEEFSAFRWQGEIPDPQDEATFRLARLNRRLRAEGKHKVLYELYRELIRLHKEVPALALLSKDNQEVMVDEKNGALFLRRWNSDSEVIIIYNFNSGRVLIKTLVPAGKWGKLLYSAETRWLGNDNSIKGYLDSSGKEAIILEPKSFVLFTMES